MNSIQLTEHLQKIYLALAAVNDAAFKAGIIVIKNATTSEDLNETMEYLKAVQDGIMSAMVALRDLLEGLKNALEVHQNHTIN